MRSIDGAYAFGEDATVIRKEANLTDTDIGWNFQNERWRLVLLRRKLLTWSSKLSGGSKIWVRVARRQETRAAWTCSLWGCC